MYTQQFLHASYCVFALLPLPRMPDGVQLLYRAAWICWLSLNIVYVGSMSVQVRWDMGYYVGSVLYVLNATANVVAVCEARYQWRHCARIQQLRADIDALLQLWLRADVDVRGRRRRDRSLARHIGALLLLQFACDVIKMHITVFATVTSIFWLYLPVELMLRVRYIQITVIIMELNQRVALLTQAIAQLAAANAPAEGGGSSSAALLHIWRPYAAWEYERLHAIRYVYGRLHKAYALVSRAFGWSLLTILMTAFFNFVCNAFWCFQEVVKARRWNVLVYNGCTTLTFGSLVWAMFWHAHAGWQECGRQRNAASQSVAGMLIAHNIRLMRAFLRQLPRAQLTWRLRLAHLTIGLLDGGLRVCGLTPLVRAGGVVGAAVNACYTAAWLLQIGCALYLVVWPPHGRQPLQLLSEVVHMLLFLTKSAAHTIVLLDAARWRHRSAADQRALSAQTERLEEALQRLRVRYERADTIWPLARQILTILLLLLGCHVAILWTLRAASAFYWHSLLGTVALQCKIIGICVPLAGYNGCAAALRRNVAALGRRNVRRLYNLSPLQRSSTLQKTLMVHVQPAQVACPLSVALHAGDDGDAGDDAATAEAELQQLRALKRLHSELYEHYQLFNACHGWVLLAFAALCFAELVCNAYWIVLALITDNDAHTYVQYVALLLIAAILLAMFCWLTQQSSNHSRQIGCLSYKLVKPLGNKRYNDLVSEFSLQVLHQPFVITAKQFFDFNLSLLGKMVAAIVTYLVILLQFMFTEKTAIEQSSAIGTASNTTKHP